MCLRGGGEMDGGLRGGGGVDKWVGGESWS